MGLKSLGVFAPCDFGIKAIYDEFRGVRVVSVVVVTVQITAYIS